MTGNLKLLCNFVEQFLGTIAPILGYGDLVQGNVTIKRVYYIKGLNHNLFFVGQLCDADLEVAFQKSTCYIRDLKENDLRTGSHGTDLYSIALQDTSTPNLICLMAKATSTQAWLWHLHLLHLNFDTINLLSKYDILIGLSKFKFVKDHLCSSSETVTTSNELDLLFSMMFDELLIGTTPVVSNSSVATATDAPNQRQQPDNSIYFNNLLVLQWLLNPLDADLSGTPVDETKYDSMVGALIYLTTSRPDIIHATFYCACYQARPIEKHLKELNDYSFHFDKIPMYCDSKAAIAISCNPVQHSHTKYIDVRYHFIKGQIEKGIVEIFFVRTEYQLADLFTKALPEDRFKYLVRRLDMRCLTPEELEVLANESALSIKPRTLTMEILPVSSSNSTAGRIAKIDAVEDLFLIDETAQDQGRINDKDLFGVHDFDGDEDATVTESVEEAEIKVEMDEEERIAREKNEANRAIIEEWDDVQATIDADRQECGENPKENSSRKLKRCLEIVPEDDDDVAVEATPLSSKSPTIVDYKIYKEGKKSCFKIVRADGNSQNYLTFRTMFKNFNIEDLEVLRSIVKKSFKKIKPVDDMDNLLFQTLKTMFEHHVEDIIWKYQQRAVKVNNWKLFDSCRVYCVTTKNMVYYLLVEKMYPFTNSILHQL
nr:retrotransposon protein, putative, unclassified [Tanacetum cinerariifolium]